MPHNHHQTNALLIKGETHTFFLLNTLVEEDSNLTSPARVFIPTKFLHFSAFGNNGRVSIGWKVSNEKDQFEYIIERSIDGVDFMPVGTLVYRVSITPVNNYSFTDQEPVTNSPNYYRVRSVDSSGHAVFSPIVKVKLSTPVGSLLVSPGTADNAASLNLVSKARGTVSIRIINGLGRSCWHLHYSVIAGPNVLVLDGLDKLPDGTYTIQCIDGRKTKHIQLLIQHKGQYIAPAQ